MDENTDLHSELSESDSDDEIIIDVSPQEMHNTVSKKARYGDVYGNIGNGVTIAIRDDDNKDNKWQQALRIYQDLSQSNVVLERTLAYSSLITFLSNKKVPIVYKIHSFNILREMDLEKLEDMKVRSKILGLFDEITNSVNGWHNAIFTDVLRIMMKVSLNDAEFDKFMYLLNNFLTFETAKTVETVETPIGTTTTRSESVGPNHIGILCNIWAIILDLSMSLFINTIEDTAKLQLKELENWSIGNLQRFLRQELSNSLEKKLLNQNNYASVIGRVCRYPGCLTLEIVGLIVNDYVERWSDYIPLHLLSISQRQKFHSDRVRSIVINIKYNPIDEDRLANVNRNLNIDNINLIVEIMKRAVKWNEFGEFVIKMVTADDAKSVREKSGSETMGFMCVGIIENLYLDEIDSAKSWGKLLASYHVYTNNIPLKNNSGNYLFLDELECSEFSFFSYVLDLCLLLYRESYSHLEKQMALDKIVHIAHNINDDSIKGIAIDKLLQTHNKKCQDEANLLLENMNAESRAIALKKRGVVYKFFDDAENSHDEHITESAERSVLNLHEWYYSDEIQATIITNSNLYNGQGITVEDITCGDIIGSIENTIRQFRINSSEVLYDLSVLKIEEVVRRCYTDNTIITEKLVKVREVLCYICVYIYIHYNGNSQKYFDLCRNLFINLEASYRICGSGIINRIIRTLISITDMVEQRMDPMTSVINRLKMRYNYCLKTMEDKDLQAQFMMEMILEASELKIAYTKWCTKTVINILEGIRDEDINSDMDTEYKEVWKETSSKKKLGWIPTYKGKRLDKYDPLKL